MLHHSPFLEVCDPTTRAIRLESLALITTRLRSLILLSYTVDNGILVQAGEVQVSVLPASCALGPIRRYGCSI